MKILVIGNGAREHALAWKIAQSPKTTQIYVAPGNAGTSSIASNLNIQPSDIKGLALAAEKEEIDLTFVGPEAPLAAGIVDLFDERSLPIIGPRRGPARIESSKVFSKNLLQKYQIPCAQSASFSHYSEAAKYLGSQRIPIVIKADGLAGGKGVIIAFSKEEANKALSDIMEAKIFGSSGNQVVIEEFLEGKEVSLLAFTDGETTVPMVPACDYKRIKDNDQGPNTGGMGSYSPPGFFNPEMSDQVLKSIIEPAIKDLSKEGEPYKGILYTGLMITPQGPKVLEFNARFGDPETQVILPRLKTDLVEIFLAIYKNQLKRMTVEWYNNACVGVVMASGGYPGHFKTGMIINGLDAIEKDAMVFQSGTRRNSEGTVVTDGGRVLTVVACGDDIRQARDTVYRNLSHINFANSHFRKDIAVREVN
jgi:phosphoribosylamine---glycine ligase